VRLVFGPDDDRAFGEARDLLLGRFERWLADGGRAATFVPGELAGDAGLALDWKWGYGDGDLARWRVEDVGEFLLEWCPRKLSASAAECESIPVALSAFVTFLESEALLAAGSSPAAEVAEVTGAVRGEFVAAMGDPSKFGLAKSLFGAASSDGVDISDQAELEEWIAEFNASRIEERRQILPDGVFAAPRRAGLPPVTMPDAEAVTASQAQAPILAMLAAFAAYVGEGRKLTQTGRLTLADAHALVDLLGTGDVMDERIGERTFKTTSSGELPGLRQVFAWAKKAGVVRVAHGRVIATKRGRALAGDPNAFFDRAVDAILAIGPLGSQRDPDAWLAWPEVNELLDRFVVHLLAVPYVAQRAVPIDDLTSVATAAVLDAFEFPSLDDGQVGRHVRADVVDIMDTLEVAGVVRRVDVPEPETDTDVAMRRRHGGSIELTAAGVAVTHRLLVDAGYDAPTSGRLSDATATELFLGTDVDDFPVLWGEVEAWRRRRDPTDAAHQLADAVRQLDDPALRNLALAVMADLDPDIAVPEVRRLAIEPHTQGFALCWLVDHGVEDAEALFNRHDLSSFIDVLAHRLVTGGPTSLCDTLALAGNEHHQIEVISRLWRSPSAATDTVLAAIGEHHPAKPVAKAARKARFQRRSWNAAPRG
jgi:hypothetical protein